MGAALFPDSVPGPHNDTRRPSDCFHTPLSNCPKTQRHAHSPATSRPPPAEPCKGGPDPWSSQVSDHHRVC